MPEDTKYMMLGDSYNYYLIYRYFQGFGNHNAIICQRHMVKTESLPLVVQSQNSDPN